MSERHKKAIHFDLDTRKLKQFYPGRNYRYAYRELKKFFVERGFTHRQRSGYISNEKLDEADVLDILEALQERFLWLENCIRKLDVSNIGAQFDLTSFLRRSAGNAPTVQRDNIVIRVEVYSDKIAQSAIQQKQRLFAYAKYFQQRGETGNPAVAGT